MTFIPFSSECELSDGVMRLRHSDDYSKITELEYFFSDDTLIIQSARFPMGRNAEKAFLLKYEDEIPK